MSARAPRRATRKAASKRPKAKLKLNKETLKDLGAPDTDIKGGALAADTGMRCNVNTGASTGPCTS